jgi:hypothetical protein
MPVQGPCEICGNQAEYVQFDFFPGRHCPRCGEFDYDTYVGWRRIISPDEIVRLSGWVREQNAVGVVPRITPEISRRVTRMRLPGWRDRASRALAAIARKISPRPGTWFAPDLVATDLELQAASYSRDREEARLLMEILTHQGYLLRDQGGLRTLSVEGLLAVEALGMGQSGSAQGFVAMWFDDSLRDAWTNGFDRGIRAAGFRPLRLDNEDYIGGVTDEIMTQIRRSRFVVVDYTGHRNSVYFEAGFAAGLGLTVIQTCRADEIDKLHFDIRHLHTLPWKSPDELAEGLNRRIRAVIGAGPSADDVPRPGEPISRPADDAGRCRCPSPGYRVVASIRSSRTRQRWLLGTAPIPASSIGARGLSRGLVLACFIQRLNEWWGSLA